MNYSPTSPNKSFIASRASICSVCDIYKVFAQSDQMVNVWFRHGIHVCITGLSSTPVCLSYSTQHSRDMSSHFPRVAVFQHQRKCWVLAVNTNKQSRHIAESGETVTTRLSAIHTRCGHNVIRNFIVAVTLILEVRSSCDLIRQC